VCWLVTVVDFVWSAIIQSRMATPVVVEPFDVTDDVTFALNSRGINGAIDALIFQRREKRFGRSIIPTHAGSTHR